MRLELTGRNVDITAGVRRIVEGKLARIERMLNNSAVSAQVVLSREKTGSRADVTLHARAEPPTVTMQTFSSGSYPSAVRHSSVSPAAGGVNPVM